MGSAEDAKVAVQEFMSANRITTVRIQAPDIDGLLRGKRIPVDYFSSSVAYKGSNIANILFGWDMVDELLDNLSYTGWHTGYPDVTLLPDLSTMRVVPWEPGTAMVTCDITELDGTPVSISPREVLKRVIRRAESSGFAPMAAYEFEFYVFEGSPKELADRKWRDPQPITHGSRTYSLYRGTGTEFLLGEIRQTLHDCGIDIEASNSEHGPGQFEVNIHYADALAAADQASILKSAVKEIAARHGYTASFMAKVNQAWAGSSGHLHQSLSNLDGSPAFANAADGDSLSAIGQQYVAGMLELTAAFTAFYCPTVNSYKRTEGGSWAGSSVTWGRDNRTVAVRAIPSTGPAARIENRIPGADANPYLVIAANVASGIYGVEKALTPPAAMIGNAYEDPEAKLKLLPGSLEAATSALRASAPAHDLLGDDFVEHFALTRDWEIRQFGRAVTDWETARYLEMT
ncbi:MAG: glutamine synthetase family protein [Actinomycetota bacterium]|nr:glutamine synthetase family protein [Actinomycetota bacterium]